VKSALQCVKRVEIIVAMPAEEAREGDRMQKSELETRTLTERLNATYGDLTTSERKVVDALRDRPGMAGAALPSAWQASTAAIWRSSSGCAGGWRISPP
jgi:hypothetical protein